jgi:hypothetical protein
VPSEAKLYIDVPSGCFINNRQQQIGHMKLKKYLWPEASWTGMVPVSHGQAIK